MGDNAKFYTETLDVVIANGESLSAAAHVDIGGVSGIPKSGFRVVGVAMPAAWTSAGLTFQGSFDGVTYYNIYKKADTAAEYTTAAGASQAIIIPSDDLCAFPFIKVRSGTSGSAVNQGAARTLELILRQVS